MFENLQLKSLDYKSEPARIPLISINGISVYPAKHLFGLDDKMGFNIYSKTHKVLQKLRSVRSYELSPRRQKRYNHISGFIALMCSLPFLYARRGLRLSTFFNYF